MKREVVIYKGTKYYRYPESKNLGARNYFRAIVALHREIYKDNYGGIPEGMHVHHKDGNALNNSPDNLGLMDGREHNRHHALTDGHFRPKTVVTCRTCGRTGPKACSNNREPAMYCSPICQTRAMTEKHKKPLREITCARCGKIFETRITNQKCCSRKCIQDWHNHGSRKEARKRGK